MQKIKNNGFINKRGFTLAEVLITLGIIGIVAAMTLPSLINNARNRDLESRFKNAYSLIYQAVLLMGNEDPQLWQTYCGMDSYYDTNYNFIRDFSKQFQTVLLYDKRTEFLNKLGYKQKYFYTATKGKNTFNYDGHNNGAFVTKNGMVIFSSGCWWARALDFVVDTNGIKGPNKFGYDVFYFQISKNNQLLPSSINTTFAFKAAETDRFCVLAGEDGNIFNYGGMDISDNGSACSRFALMDRFPGDENKSYWKNLPIP